MATFRKYVVRSTSAKCRLRQIDKTRKQLFMDSMAYCIAYSILSYFEDRISANQRPTAKAGIIHISQSQSSPYNLQESLREKISKFDSDTLAIRQTVVEQKDRVEAAEQESESLREQVKSLPIFMPSICRIVARNVKCMIYTELGHFRATLP